MIRGHSIFEIYCCEPASVGEIRTSDSSMVDVNMDFRGPIECADYVHARSFACASSSCPKLEVCIFSPLLSMYLQVFLFRN